ncbi:hypothetical protein PN39_05590 [Vibrio anguillarum]|uniref:GDSL-type esterase/lipase family protein n=1 Tax=Vibrio anguillarum TaxID=55601 RepID=UPI001C03E47A|nr:GDSL-type esterase/lipase family protein [Vibrio anguillarum]MBT2925348.1 hypothetical protein [Vibrio anguillarum]
MKKYKRNITLGYVLFLHLLVIVIVAKSDVLPKVKKHLGVLTSEITPHYKKMVTYHERMDSSVPDNAVIFIGDSITEALATAAITDKSVNYGIGGDTTYGVLKRISLYKSLDRAKLVVIAVGVNDLNRRSNNEIVDNYSKILQKIPKETNILISSILPIANGYKYSNPEYNDRISNINQSLELLSKSLENVYFLDATNKLLNKNGALSNSYHIGDGLHLSKEGYKVWIDSLSLAITEIEY